MPPNISVWGVPIRSAMKPASNNKKAWNLAKKRAGIKGRVRWHDIRHSSLSHLLLIKKQNITKVSEYAGVSVRTLQRVYLHSTAEQTKEVGMALSVTQTI